MKVLVVIPTHDREEFWADALKSVEQQTRKADEVVLTGNVGPGVITGDPLYERLNAAIEQSDCDGFIVLCDDDKLDARYIERTVEAMERTAVDIVYTDCHIFGDRNCEGYALGEWTQQNIDRNTVPLVTSLCKKSAWQKAGGFADVPLFDWDFWWRCFYSEAKAFWLREHLFYYRDHANQDSKSIDIEEQKRFILARHEELRRTQWPM